jgi:response regulator RpfG family c-di-GMP phosphodiesterase
MEKFYVLLVDDEQSILRSLKFVLKSDGYEVYTAENGLDALEIAKENPIDLIISDQQMPKMTGNELFKKVHAFNPDIICILLTGQADVNIAVEAINKGRVYKFFTKPWDDVQLKIDIRLALEYLVGIRERRKQMEVIKQQNIELKEYSIKLQDFNQKLETMVEERTFELVDTINCNQKLIKKLNDKIKKLESTKC